MYDDFIKYIDKQLSELEWISAEAIITIASDGGYGIKVSYINDNEELNKLLVPVNMWNRLTEKMIEDYAEAKNGANKFNQIKLKFSVDNEVEVLKVNDLEIIRNELRDAAEFIPQWINDRMISLIYEEEKRSNEKDQSENNNHYESTWDKGLFSFTIMNNTVDSNIILIKDNTPKIMDLKFSNHFIEAILNHYKDTNIGLLKDEWKPWNKLEIHSPHNDLPYGKFDEYVFYSLTEIV